jgi:hypothetical protein
MTKDATPREDGLSEGLGAPSETDLAELLALVRGEGRWRWLGKWLTSHPQATEDKNQQRIHAAMLILEERGHVCRHYVSDSGSVTWAPNAEVTGLGLGRTHDER